MALRGSWYGPGWLIFFVCSRRLRSAEPKKFSPENLPRTSLKRFQGPRKIGAVPEKIKKKLEFFDLAVFEFDWGRPAEDRD